MKKTITHLNGIKCYCLFFVLLCSIGKKLNAQTAEATFHCISLYWTPSGATASKNVQVVYRKTGTTQWFKGFDLVYNPISGNYERRSSSYPLVPFNAQAYRGSLVNLTPGTSYEIKMTLEGTSTTTTITKSTMSETFNGTTALSLSANRTTPITVNTSGTAGNYQIYDGNDYQHYHQFFNLA